MSNHKELENLLKAASSVQTVEFSYAPLDVFFRITGFSMDDLSARLYVDDVYYVYAEFYYKKFKRLPHRKKFTMGSNIFKVCQIRRIHPTKKGKLSRGVKCSQIFKQYIDRFKEENTTWQKKYKDLLNAKKAKQQRRKNKKERLQQEKQINDLLLKNGSILK